MRSFKNILVPVDFTINTDVAINKTLELIDDEKPMIHLLHVTRLLPFKKDARYECEKKLKEWKESIEDFRPSVVVQLWIDESVSVHTSIKEKAEKLKADLIIIGQSSMHNWFPVLKTVWPMRLSASTQIPVLTVKPGALMSKSKIVVVPVTGDIPDIKIKALELLCKKTRMTIHLVAFGDDRNDLPELAASALLKAYQWLKTKLHCSVEYAVIRGTNKAKSILLYAQKNSADILLVYPKKETQLGWWDQHISDVLPADSKMQVLAVQPMGD